MESDLGLVGLTKSSSIFVPSNGLYFEERPVIGSCQSLGGSSSEQSNDGGMCVQI